MTGITRRHLLTASARVAAGGAAAAAAFRSVGARAADEIRLKIATDAPGGHPVTLRMIDCADRIAARTDGRVKISVYHSGQLGSGPQFLNQVRSGSLEMCALSTVVLGSLVPSASISGVAFVFKDYDDVWGALDGDLGAYMRDDIRKAGLHVFDRMWDVGFRQVTTRDRAILKPEDLRGVRLRVPPARLWTSLFVALGAAPTTVQMAELYSALQTRIVDGQENPIAIIESAKFSEVQKHCALTNHMWDGVHILANPAIWNGLPADVRTLVAKTFDNVATAQRGDVRMSNGTMLATLKAQGMSITEPDRAAFRATLKTAGFYTEWKEKFPAEGWALLEKYAGSLA